MKNTIDNRAWDKVLAELSRQLAEPTAALPSVQVLTEASLRRCLLAACQATGGKKTLTSVQMLTLLQESGLAMPVSWDVVEGKKPVIRLWQIGFGRRGDEELNPLELLQAAKPQGVICYFSALSHHGLTTQIPSHHHVAVLVQKERGKPQAGNVQSEKVPKPGTFLFSHGGLPYYWTSRLASMVPGTERIYLSDKAIICVTTLEQTLLDTLHRPWSCGGPPVVFEAWEQGMERFKEERLFNYLQRIDHSLWTRRAGCMLELIGHRIVHDGLACLLEKAKAEAVAAPPAFLLPAVPGNRLNSAWNLEVG
jgi:hypothetical protein